MSLIIRGKENNKILSLPSKVDIGPVIFLYSDAWREKRSYTIRVLIKCHPPTKNPANYISELPAFCKIIFVNGEQKTDIKIKTSHCNRKFHKQTTF